MISVAYAMCANKILQESQNIRTATDYPGLILAVFSLNFRSGKRLIVSLCAGTRACKQTLVLLFEKPSLVFGENLDYGPDVVSFFFKSS